MEIIFIALLTFIAALVGTMTGFGTSTLMIPVLVFFLPPVEAIFLAAIIHWFGNVWKVGLFREGINIRLLALFGIVGIAASFIGAYVPLGVHEDIFVRFLGVFLAGYALLLFTQTVMQKEIFKIPATGGAAIIGGVFSGFFAGMFGIGGAIRAAFLSAFDLPKAVHIATLGAIGLLVDSTRIIAFMTGGVLLPKHLLFGLFFFIPASFLGAEAAKHIVEKIPRDTFRVIIAFFLFFAGIKLGLFPAL